jgi:hypothetical protein
MKEHDKLWQKNLAKLLDLHDLKKKIIAHVNNESENLNAITTTIKYIINCEVLGMEEGLQSTCCSHAIFKACQYGTIEKKVCKNFKTIFLLSLPSLIYKSAYYLAKKT